MNSRSIVHALIVGVAILLSSPAIADGPLAEAIKRGLVGKPTSPRQMSAERWNREQRAAFDKSESIMQRALKEPGLLARYEWMRSHYDADDGRIFRMIFGQYLSWFQTWIGDYDGARVSFSLAQPAQADDAASPIAGGFHPTAARAAILRLTRDRRAVFFNESHSAPVTRTFTLALLADLRAQGFDYFAAETLVATPSQGAYPTARSGFYVDEPIYGEMIRAAMRLGYHVVAYDAEEGATAVRERAGAQALYEKVFKHDPAARLVVNAGFSHIQKSGDYFGGASMAEIFHTISGIEPLTIEQTMMIEHPRSDDDHPFYRAAIAAAHPDAAFVFESDAGTPWTLKPTQYDVTVFFPPETRSDGRPDWVSLDGARRPVAVSGSDCLQHFPCLLEARYAAEGDDAVAADRVVLTADARSRLYVYPGDYQLAGRDRAGKIIVARTVHVDAAN